MYCGALQTERLYNVSMCGKYVYIHGFFFWKTKLVDRVSYYLKFVPISIILYNIYNMRSTAFYERANSYNRCTNKKNDERRERENEKASERGSCCVCIMG